MTGKSNSRRKFHPLIAAAAAAVLGLPSLSSGQSQIDAGRANDASNRIGSGGRNVGYQNPNYNSNAIQNYGNRIVTGNVSQGREFRGPVPYADPYSFRGRTAGIVSDEFAKNSAGVPRAGAPTIVPNTSVPFYGAAQTVAPPPGFQLNASRTGFIPPPTTTGQRAPQDQRMGVVDLNQPMTPTPAPGDMMMRGNLNPQQAAQQLGVLTGSTLYGVREWNPQDPADRAFLQNILNRQSGASGINTVDPRQVQRMRDELDRALDRDRVDPGQMNNGVNGGANGQQRPQDSLTLDPIGRTFESPTDPAVAHRPITDQVQAQPIGAAGVSTEQGMRYNLLGRARRTSEQYAELNKRLDQFYSERRKSDADFAREYNADVLKKRQADERAKAEEARRNAVAGLDPTKSGPNTLPNPNSPNPAGGRDTPAGADKPRAPRPQPVKVGSLATGVRGEGLANVLKKAEALMKEGKYASALDQYDAAEAVTPNNPLIWLGRGNAELAAGFFMRADGHLRQALATDRALLMGQYDLTAMIGEERLTRIVGELKDQANRDATKATPLFLLAYIAYNTGHEQQALGYLELAEKRGGDAGFFKLLKDHWALPDGGDAAKPDGAAAPKPELNK